jgi:leader peptidase (prepilin peptidase)/N-methyltransferase
MDLLVLLLVFIFGTIIGSFLNVVSLRFNTGKNIGGRSACMLCGKKLVWYELFPVLSYLLLKGECSKCKTKISWQYPLVETITGLLFVLIFIKVIPNFFTAFDSITISSIQFLWIVLYIVISCILIVISVYDVKHKIIPDPFVYAFIIISFISIFIGQQKWFMVPSLSSLLAGPLLALPFALVWLLSKGSWMGFGDAKLVLGIGWILGLGAGGNAIILAFWIAAFFSILWLLITRRSVQSKTEIPFGPYLIIGMYIVLFFNVQVIDFSLALDMLKSLIVF